MLDGRTEVFEGHRTFPATEHTDTLRLAPSNDKVRLDAVVTVFQKYADEATCPTVIAKYLNTLGIKPYYAERWEHYHVREMLKNPIYIGRQRWNSHGQGRFHEFIGGQECPVTNPRGGRIRSKNDWVLSDDQLFKPLVPLGVWEKVQAKLEREPPKRRAPRSSDLWFAGLLHCAHCGKPMRGMQRPTRSEYFCSSYAQGKEASGCLRHNVNHALVEEYILKYLQEAGIEIGAMMDAQQTGNVALLRPFEDRHIHNICETGRAIKGLFDAITSHPDWEEVLRDCGGKKGRRKPPETLDEFHQHFMEFFIPVQKAYMVYFKRDEAVVQERLKALDEEHTALTQRVLNLDPMKAQRAIEKVNQRIGVLEEELQTLEAKLTNLSEEFDRVRDEMIAQCNALAEAKRAMDDPTANDRRKAQAVRSCIDQINVTFRPTGKKYPKSEIVKIEIIPRTQQTPEYPAGASCCRAGCLPGCHSSSAPLRPAG
jgi:hypothetical protein